MLPIGPKVQAHVAEDIVEALDNLATAKGVKRPDILREVLEGWYSSQYALLLWPERYLAGVSASGVAELPARQRGNR